MSKKRTLDTWAIYNSLALAVDSFNKFHSAWQAKHPGAEAVFGWSYRGEVSPVELVLLRIKEEGVCEEAFTSMQETLDGFNAWLGNWHKDFGCFVNFVWGMDKDNQRILEVATIDYPVFRLNYESDRLSEVLESTTMKEVLGENNV